jgi:thiol-disulfide isomerase/thioredoxin
MSLEFRLILIASLVLLATLIGLAWRLTTGRAKKISSGEKVDLAELGAVKNGRPVTSLTTKVTFLQFSSDYCVFCGPTARMFGELEQADSNVTHLEVNITNRLDLANKYNVLQTPTTLVLDRKGFIKSRIGGAPKQQTVIDQIGTFDI